MNNIKNVFTIKDLEHLTGVKAHTIRIWEKRYKVLQPLRTETNIRIYDVHNLQKLLNIKTLNSFGYKISTIAKMDEADIPKKVREIQNDKNIGSQVVSNFKLAMMNFDQQMFYSTYSKLLSKKPFTDIFYDCFVPLLEEIGDLWQTDTISPAHEHFISALIKQKIACNTEQLHPFKEDKNDTVFVLYLPEGEIHEIGLMFTNYELLRKGCKTLYVGESVPLSNVKDIKNYFNNVTFVTYITIDPPHETERYINLLKKEVINDNESRLVMLGRNTERVNNDLFKDNVNRFQSIKHFIDSL